MKKEFIFLLSALMMILATVSTSAQQSFILNVQGQTMSFTNAQRTVVINTGNSGTNAGSKHRYANVITKDGIVVYAILHIVQKVNATITNFDDDNITGEETRFQPRIGSGSGGGYIVYELEFFNTANDASVFLYNYNITGIDIDGNSSSNREYVEVGGYTNYTVNNPTGLTISTNAQSGRTRFLGITNSLPGVTFDNSAAFIANFVNPNNKISFALGQTGSNDERFYSVQIGVAGGVFSNPVVVPNPLPVAVDDVGTPLNGNTGGVAVPNVLDNDIYNNNPINISQVNLTLANPPSHPGIVLNTANGQVTVAPGTPGGTYTFEYQICMKTAPSDCDIATVTVKVLEADMEISKSGTPNPVIAGQEVTYTIVIVNNGPTEANDVNVTDVLHAALTIQSVTPSVGTWTSPTWTVGTLNESGSATLTIVALVDASFTGILENIAIVSTSTFDPVSNNNQSTASITVNPPVGPTATDDNVTTIINTPVNISVLQNDVAGSVAIDQNTLTFVPGTEPNPFTIGGFSYDAVTGIVTFTPANNYVGVATIDYQVCDQNSLCDIATITVTIIMGATNLYPALGPGTLAYEDLWPGKGDYDFNDLVLDYQFEILTNPGNFIEQVNATFTIRAFGASFENGFGFQLSDAINAADLTVTGFDLSEGFVTLDPNGTEANQSKPTIIVYENAFNLMPHPGSGIGVNTTPGSPYVQPVTIVIGIQFKPNTYSYNDLDIANFNPFLIVNKVRGHEVHLPDYPPTDLADVSLFGMWEDDSDPQTGKYYLTANNLPWAINIYESFDYPKEKQEIIWAHLKFAEWATSGGVLFPDWYKNLQGYRNIELIYSVPTGN